jgi:hypothetical protein
MPRSYLTHALALAAFLLPAGSAQGQLPVETWTDRPDARGPAGLTDDLLIGAGEIELLFSAEYSSFEGHLVETQEYPDLLVLNDWTTVPLSMNRQRLQVEFRYGIKEWLSSSIRLPVSYQSVEIAAISGATESPSALGLGDIEAQVLYTLHDMWPYRAHLIGGISIPTGPTGVEGPNPASATDETLPYPVQPGSGTFALLPGLVFVAENGSGTVGLKTDFRLPFGENSRGWRRGSQFNGHLWMAYRFSDWLSGSLRVTASKTGDVAGGDPTVDPVLTPMGDPTLQGGTRVVVPIGINFMFPRGPYWANRLGAEFILPLHQNLDGPQIRQSVGASILWALEF